MASNRKGKIAVDIRDSVPDWSPYLPPRPPRGCPERADHRVGRRGLRQHGRFRRSHRDPHHAAHRRRRRALLEFPHDGAVFAHPRIAADRSQRHVQRDGHGRRTQLRVPPRHLDPHPLRERIHLRGTGRTGLEHLLHRQMASDPPERGMQHVGGQEPVAARPRLRTLLRISRRRVEQLVPGSVYDNHPIEAPATPEDGYHLSKDLSDKSIEFIRDAKAVDPDKPFFMYLAPQAGHAPHHVPAEWADRYKGKFDQGYEAIRAEILARQKELGLLPADTELSPINPHGEPNTTGPDGQLWPMLDTVRPWDSLTADEQRLFIRMAEVFAGFISYADDQLGRVIDFLADSGELDNTLLVVISDNGASGEGGPNGSFNEWRFFNGVADSTEVTLPHLDELGGPASYNHYNTGWAWAFDTPFPYWKRWAGYEGGIATCAWSPGRRSWRPAPNRCTSTFTRSMSCPPSTNSSASNRPRCSRATHRVRSRARASRRR